MIALVPQVYETTGEVTGGKLRVRNKAGFEEAFRHWRDGEVVVTIERVHARRSLAQNAYWHAVVVRLFSDHCGYPPTEMHEVLKQELLPERRELVNPTTGEIKEHIVGGSTKRLNKIEFGDLIRRAQQLGAEMHIYIPDPNEDDTWATRNAVTAEK